MAALYKIAVRNLGEPEAHVRRARRELGDLAARYGSITGVRFALCRDDADGYEAHLELLLPRHQLIVNASGPTPEMALGAVHGRALEELNVLAGRDRGIRPAPQAKAA